MKCIICKGKQGVLVSHIQLSTIEYLLRGATGNIFRSKEGSSKIYNKVPYERRRRVFSTYEGKPYTSKYCFWAEEVSHTIPLIPLTCISSKTWPVDLLETIAIRGTALVKFIDDGLVNLTTVFFDSIKRLKLPSFYVNEICYYILFFGNSYWYRVQYIP